MSPVRHDVMLVCLTPVMIACMVRPGTVGLIGTMALPVRPQLREHAE